MSNTIQIQIAQEEEDLAVGELLVTAFLTTYARKMPEVVVTERRIKELRDVKSRREESTVYTAYLDNRLAGTVCLYRPGHPHSEAWSDTASCLRMLAVDPSARGKNVSTQLIQACITLSKEWQASAIQLHVRRGAHGISAMYEKHGFKRTPEGDLDLLPEIYLHAYELKL